MALHFCGVELKQHGQNEEHRESAIHNQEKLPSRTPSVSFAGLWIMLVPLVPNLSEDGLPTSQGQINRFAVAAFDAGCPDAFHFGPRNELGERPCAGQIDSIASHI